MGDYTLQEILSQPEIWRRTLALMRGESSPLAGLNELVGDGPVLFTGCGSSYYLSLAAAAFWSRHAGGRAFAVSATDLLTYPECHLAPHLAGTLMAVSRSGRSMETCEAARYLRQSLGWRVMGLTCTPASALLELCHSALVLADAAEKSRFTTRALTATLLAVQLLAAARTRNAGLEQELLRLPELADGLLQRHGSTLQDLARTGDFNQYIYLGQGPYYGLAAESMLKTKEMGGTPAEAYQSLELMHGPRYAVNASTLIWVLLSEAGLTHQLALLPKLKNLNAQVAVVCERAAAEVQAHADLVLELDSGLSDYGRMLLVMPLMQLFAYHRACALGKTVD